MDRISPNFIYALILTRMILGLLHIIFCSFCTRVMALDLFQNSASAQYLENKWTDFTKLYITIYTDKIYVWIFSCYFLQICTSVMALDLRQNFVSISIS